MNEKENNKIEHLWSVLCETALIDNETNNISLLNIVEQLSISSVPQVAPVSKEGTTEISTIPIKFEIVSFFQRRGVNTSNLEVDATLTFLDPKNKIIKDGQFKILFPKGMKRLRFRTKMNGLPVTTPGEYRFLLKIKEGKDFHEISSLPVDIKIEAKI
ncbi:MAG: hypothetical protein A2481_00560 [Candidatus Yonathbacteria bacterium RIFOXYC2_FULL_47_9]|nr:MAG: hypothetical protein A2481_00560 [Candidatus Yonathbacteria bacterium RIFOXYC2_FULL_47_9]HAT68128.1 hypothetical protein [Candidatus Yonathbacteria bacterium]